MQLNIQLNIGQTANILGISQTHVRERGERMGLVPVRTVGGHRRYTLSNVLEVKASLQQAGQKMTTPEAHQTLRVL